MMKVDESQIVDLCKALGSYGVAVLVNIMFHATHILDGFFSAQTGVVAVLSSCRGSIVRQRSVHITVHWLMMALTIDLIHVQ